VPVLFIASIAVLAGCRGAAAARPPQPGSAALGERSPRDTVWAICLDFARDTGALPTPIARFVVLFDSVPARDTLQYGLNWRAEWWRDTTDQIPVAIGAWSGNPIGGKYQPTYAGFQCADSARVLMGINIVDGTLYALARVYPVRGALRRGDEPLLRGEQRRCRRSPHAALQTLLLAGERGGRRGRRTYLRGGAAVRGGDD
jgi:hypothetical protein